MRSNHPFGTLLGRLRVRKKGLTQSKLAEMAGYDPAVITRMGQGKQDLTGPQARERVIRVIQALHESGVLNGAEEANALLDAASLPPLSTGNYSEAELLQQLAKHRRLASDNTLGLTLAPRPAWRSTKSMEIRIASVLVDDQDKALRFYTEILGFVKKSDSPDGPFRWLTVVSKEGVEGIELELQAMHFPAAREYQKAQFDAEYPTTMFFTKDIQAEYTRLKNLGVVFRGEPVKLEHTRVFFEDGCGNLINLIETAESSGLAAEHQTGKFRADLRPFNPYFYFDTQPPMRRNQLLNTTIERGTMTAIQLPLSALTIPGLVFRTLCVDADYPQIVAINNICWPLDGRVATDTLEDRQRHWSGQENFDPQNVLVVEVEGLIIGYATISWEERSDIERWHYIYAVLLPQWRRKGIGGAIQDWIEARTYEINATLPAKENCLFETYCFDVVAGKAALLKQRGYHVVWHGDMMDRSLEEPIPNFDLPAGIECRPAQMEHIRQIYEALHEGQKPEPEPINATEAQVKDFVAYLGTDHLDLWQIAWDTASNEIAGVVIGCADEMIHPRTGQKHGDLQSLSIRHKWRKRGIAKALIARCLAQLRHHGMGIATIGVFDENADAIRLYERFGFRNAQGMTGYQKKLVS